ncbi:hypothetical protein EJB05_48401 [Eragrostis curvula]|uniref:RING-type domain-containing protein n=1 Tax=Eragrostis curvula TaxID=38414 RepID=A0A5J9T1K8_9POAL|nr:hypothetical protein EJB05_48401 [Eragrostis curvula]
MADNTDGHNYANVDLVCCLCDNGGEIASCEGRCLRSFHATKDSCEDCQTLGYSRLQFDAMKVFMCKNCEYERYQCFACGRLGSAKTDRPEVFPCASATCGHFYHAKCVAQLLFPENDAKTAEYTAKISNGAKFACPVHKCDICKKIAFEDYTENGQCFLQRAWDDLLPNNRILIYCLKHDIDPELGTPPRNHIKFPDDPAVIRKPLNQVNGMKKKLVKVQQIEKHPSAPLSSVKRSSTVKHASLNNLMNKRRKVPVSQEKPVVMEKSVNMSTLPFSSFPEIDRNTEMRIYEFAHKASADITIEDVHKKLVVPSTHTTTQNADKITLGKVERSVEAVKAALHMLEHGACIEEAKTICAPSDLFQLAKWKNKLNIFLAPFLHGMRYTSYGRHFTKLDKLQLVDTEATVVKCTQIVDKLQWYIQSGDTVVDFCCGSNDFSLLLKEKLEASGKSCSYKNYDLIQPKNDFNFERRDWMTVQPDELPSGCRMIMGLNPPFGFKSSLANQFINKALSFKPKLIILIVPKETERLDKKYPPYELIWEDSNQLSGKSFYLPGSFDADNKVMEQWNVSAPPLSLWSRSDWAKRHSEIARSMRHVPSENASHINVQSEATMHVEMDDARGTAIHDSVLDQLLADTYHDATNSPGDCWNDTNGRSRQPCNYENPGWSDPTQKHHVETRAESDMSISLSDRADYQRQDQTSSISKHGGTDPQDCNAAESATAEKSTAPADCDEVTSACGPYHLPGDLPLPPPGRPSAGVKYWRLEDSPLVEEPAASFLFREPRDAPPVGRLAAAVQYQQMEDTPPTPTPEDSWSGETDDSPPAVGHAGNLPRSSTFPGLPSRHGCYTSHQFISQGMGHQAVRPGPSSSG